VVGLGNARKPGSALTWCDLPGVTGWAESRNDDLNWALIISTNNVLSGSVKALATQINAFFNTTHPASVELRR
jgi:hypothetical protein